MPEDRTEIPETGFLGSLPLPAVMFDAGGRIIGANPGFSRLTGYAPGELSGSEGFSLLCPPDRDMMRSAILRTKEGTESVPPAVTILRKDGSHVRVSTIWSTFAPDPSRPPLSLGIFVEIPAGNHPAHPAAVIPAIVPVHDEIPPGATSTTGSPSADTVDPSRRDQIIHTIIFHDAKNRFSAIHGYADLLRQSLPGSGFLSYVDKLEEITADIERDLGVASMLSHVGFIAPQWQNIREAVVRSANREPPGTIVLDDLSGSLWCLADPLFPRVFSNLFENARRHGERVTMIRIRAEEGKEGLVISVKDDGIGIPADQKERIFEHGFGKHTGYGLFLAREILHIAGFSIRETGDPGKGARFDIHIPRGRYARRPSRPEESGPVRIPAA